MYVELANLKGRIPEPFLTQALDDDNDGAVDAWAEVQAQACNDVDAPLSGRYSTPLPAPYPAIAVRAAQVFAAELCYLRRSVSPNPWTAQADELRKTLAAIGAGDEPLTPVLQRAQPSGTVIGEPARTFSKRGALAV